ncbi:MAG: hypothetical protein RBS55_00765 [Bacteroidales bacterium]|jgi:predicted AAA+ superfamily ATPase|nr:hypothetical protein [Bacteroidales bacterium]
MIKRNLEDRIVNALQFFPALAILGPRQVGKTTLAKMVREKIMVNDLKGFLEKLKNQ